MQWSYSDGSESLGLESWCKGTWSLDLKWHFSSGPSDVQLTLDTVIAVTTGWAKSMWTSGLGVWKSPTFEIQLCIFGTTLKAQSGVTLSSSRIIYPFWNLNQFFKCPEVMKRVQLHDCIVQFLINLLSEYFNTCNCWRSISNNQIYGNYKVLWGLLKDLCSGTIFSHYLSDNNFLTKSDNWVDVGSNLFRSLHWAPQLSAKCFP